MINHTIDITMLCTFKSQKSNPAATKGLQAHYASCRSDLERPASNTAQTINSHINTFYESSNVILRTNYLINKCTEQAYDKMVHSNYFRKN